MIEVEEAVLNLDNHCLSQHATQTLVRSQLHTANCKICNKQNKVVLCFCWNCGWQIYTPC